MSCQVTRCIRVTPDTMKAVTTLLNSVMRTLQGFVSTLVFPSQMARSMRTTTLFRWLKRPDTIPFFESGGFILFFGTGMISMTFATLTP